MIEESLKPSSDTRNFCKVREDMAQLTVETIDQVLDGVIAQRASNLDLWHITFIDLRDW